ncbi:helix-turn-helix domain-containing protein [Roseospira marina]|uniref:Helix-turn-helix domain-containing protein n=1 Tax=Roseospira marina TaxID=140057 RepID=A0A5M6I7W4_9PROT|nr:helix-turn-helix domain-containing protein [Roseospira marina]KAA5604232.1 helix-turn-helix domain-containing protein [Roseospira marina]MBB4315622.1 Cu(I)-responsive transcriptional regulator [Roseospira marina]MBB5088618.1 Cu(I)-responsive transcriptional regulator [Roseospira marina]
MSGADFKIGDLARATGTKVVTIRYYETIGLIAPPGRSEANYRRYDTAALDRLRFIRRCRDLGFSLGDIRELLDLSSETERPCDEVNQITAAHLAEVEKKIADLQALAVELRRISTSCHGGGTISNCRILDAITPD